MVARRSNRREFLAGKSAIDAAENVRGQTGHVNVKAESASGTPAEVTADRTYLLEIGRRAMACEFQVMLNANQYEHGPEAAVEALDLVEQLEEQLTVYRERSEISRLNQSARTQAARVEERLFQLLSRAVQLFHDTGGAFDITAGPLVRAWGFFRRQGRLPDASDLSAAMSSVGANCIVLCRDSQSVQFTKPAMEINLGGIGKGHALDRSAEMLQGQGIHDFLLHGGQSSILARGSRLGTLDKPGWRVGLTHPLRRDTRLGEIRLVDQALGTSGTTNQYFHHQGKRYCHVIDPRTGWPASKVLSATVLARDATSADALSTAFFVMGVEAARKYCREHTDVSAIFVLPKNKSVAVEVLQINEDGIHWTG